MPSTLLLTTLTLLTPALAADPPRHVAMPLAESLAPYRGPVVSGVDTSTIRRKVMCGYQGWFMAKGDGFAPGFVHWGGVDREPPRCSVDLWPDLTELGPDERFATNYRHADGTRAEVFSSTVKATVLRHFQWMRDYGIDGVWVQRFTSCVGNQRDWNYQRTCAVLSHCREGASRYGRSFAVMYDTDFDRRAVDAMKADWARLVREMEVTRSPAYQRHRGGPVVALWGYGFGHRKFDAAASEELFRFLQEPANGGCTIMLGVPNDWATWTDDRMRLLQKYAAIISPWNVGRYGTPAGAQAHAKRYFAGDLEVCRRHDKDYYVVAFPGFSWANLVNGRSPLNQIPRLGGRFFWSQIEEIRRARLDMVYVAMFDEVDEGTAIFKCTNQPPVGRFCTYEGLPSDHYLHLAGLAGRLLRGEEVSFPQVAPDPQQTTYRPLSQLEWYRQPSTFAPATISRWREWFRGVPVVLHDEPYSDWLTDLYNTGALDLRPSTWRDMLAAPVVSPLMVIATGNEGFGAPEALVPAVVEALRAHLRRGGTLLVLSGGAYPLFYPGGGAEAAKAGLRLRMGNAPAGSQVRFDARFAPALQPWTLRQPGAARPMRRDLYPTVASYTSLARVTLPDGADLGDAVAVVVLGGELAPGRLVYVASDLLGCPQREALLDAVLAQARPGAAQR